jgi:hypothetical protein
MLRVAILSDVHYASAEEQARGNDYEYRELENPILRLLLKIHRRHFWLQEPLNKNYLLDKFLQDVVEADKVVAVGDYSCNSAFVGVSDPAACESARQCLAKLRVRFGTRLHPCFGDHELGKFALVGKRGGMRLESWRRARNELQLEPLWRVQLGRYVLMGVASPLIILPRMTSEVLPDERAEWEALRARHMAEIREAFGGLPPEARVLLFCHDPTALSFLWREETVRSRLGQVDHTIIGHLHSNLIWRLSRVLAGMPVLRFVGHSAHRLSMALHDAKCWRHFNVRLCPSIAGIELLKDGGYLTLELDPEARLPSRFAVHRLAR